MLKILLISVLGMSFFWIQAQENKKNLDLIIVVDGNILSSTFTDIKIKVLGEKVRFFNVTYYPGNLSLKSEYFNELLSDSIKNIFLKFNYYDYSTAKQKIYNYEIPINKKWLSENFFIIKFYNTDKEKNDGIPPLRKGENYNFDIISPNCTYILLRNKSK
jgi:hypothetical protein